MISSSSAWAHGVLVDPGAVHVCYCHNPFRYAWTEREATLRARATRSCARRCASCSPAGASGTGSPPSASTATSPTRSTTAERVRALPRPRVDRAAPAGGDRPLLPGAGRRPLRRARRADGAQAHRRRGRGLHAPRAAARRGRRRPRGAPAAPARRADRLASPGGSPTREVAELLAGARALVVTAVEEFGIAAVEAQAAGRPVIALGEGGVLESVQPGVTGAFYERNEPAALAETVLALRHARGRPGRLPRRRRALQRRALPEPARRDRGRRRLRRAPAAAEEQRPVLARRAASGRAPLEQAERAEARRRRGSAAPGRRRASARRSSARRRWARRAAVTGSVQRTTSGVRVRSRSRDDLALHRRGGDDARRRDVVAGRVARGRRARRAADGRR